jgi:hypothetical protein
MPGGKGTPHIAYHGETALAASPILRPDTHNNFIQ